MYVEQRLLFVPVLHAPGDPEEPHEVGCPELLRCLASGRQAAYEGHQHRRRDQRRPKGYQDVQGVREHYVREDRRQVLRSGERVRLLDSTAVGSRLI